MSEPEDFELTPEERGALERLPRERVPDAGLRERTLAELRRRGAFGEPAAARASFHGVRGDAGPERGDRPRAAPAPGAWSARWLVGTAAAAFIFSAGIGVGSAIRGAEGDAGPRAEAPAAGDAPAAGATGASNPTGAATPASVPLAVQRYGSAYVEAIARLAEEGGSADPQGRDAALSAFRGAAEHLTRLDGHDAATRQILLAARGLEPAAEPGAVERWF